MPVRTDTPITFHRQDYQAPSHWIDQIELDIALIPAKTIVVNRMQVKRNPVHKENILFLNGVEQELISIKVNNHAYEHYEQTAEGLKLFDLPEQFELAITSSCCPEKNTSLMGLYVSNGNFFTQCEAEGFRKITYFLDRPDVMSKYKVTLRAIKQQLPVLLSNGNLVKEEDLGNGWHAVTWEDPFYKPCYLFALVAGKLACIERRIQTELGRSKLLQVWVEAKDLDKTKHAMDSLIASIRWDEKRFGLELDLDRFMIVAVSDFNMGAMENKGLNIFNTKFVLAHPETATDIDYANIESVVAHEYFHNWTGNRVTCRDWFQLSLKEGLTVFRDQEFSADQMGSASGRAVKRIEDVRLLRQIQFPEDAGPMAHPIRPDSYQEINNFYTVTVYEKGAEIIRMQQTLLGQEGFRKGMDLYFARHDGQAVTCDDFVAAMSDANQKDLEQFKRWYSQAGTPRVHVTESYEAGRYRVQLSQTCPPTPGQANKEPFHIPLLYKLIGVADQNEQLFELKDREATIEWTGLSQKPILSINRHFSAPIILEFEQSNAELLTLFANDDDAFNRWEAIQKIYVRHILDKKLLDTDTLKALEDLLLDPHIDPAFKELVFTLPAESYLYEQVAVIEPQELHYARRSIRAQLANSLQNHWLHIYQTMNSDAAYSPDPKSMGQRSLKNLALQLLAESAHASSTTLLQEQYTQANNMTDRYGALSAMVQFNHPQTDHYLADFHQRFSHDALVIDKWFMLQATRQPMLDGSRPLLDDIQYLRRHPDFQIKNPNRVRSLIHAFCMNNHAGFHIASGASYPFWAEQVIELDSINPQVAARLARALDRWQQFASPYREKMESALKSVAAHQQLSADVSEIIQKALQKN